MHNKYSIHFDDHFTDGGLLSPTVNPDKRNLQNFCKSWRKGHRYRILIHPQYYYPSCLPLQSFKDIPWYQKILNTYDSEEKGNFWKNLQLNPKKGYSYLYFLKKLHRRWRILRNYLTI